MLLDHALDDTSTSQAIENLVDAVRKASPLAPLVAGNQVTILNDGPATFEAYAGAIGNAVHHVHVETFIFADDALGQSFAELLAVKSQQGVMVRVLYDGVGSLTTDAAFFDKLRRAGVQVIQFRPLDNLAEAISGKVNQRDHRKLLIVDGRQAFVGGINISETYDRSAGSWSEGQASLRNGWRDVQIRLDGPVVQQYQALFLSSWIRAGGSVDATATDLYPRLHPSGSSLVAALASEFGDESEAAIHTAYLAAIRHARQRIWITQAYFAPDRSLLLALAEAARRGVDTRVLVPGSSDSNIVLHASRAVYEPLLASGVKISEYDAGFVHSKTMTVDGVLTFIGSANMDLRSLLHNNEVTAVIADAEVAARMDDIYRRDLTNSRAVDHLQWRTRSLWQRILEQAASVFWFWI